MFSFLDYSGLQHYWWILVSLLGALLVFLLFVQGGQSLIYTLASNEKEKTMLLNSTGRKWEITFTTLVTFGGAFFASFPLFYSTSFGGAYWVWMAILFAFILQAVSYEFRSKANNFLGHKTFEAFLFLNGVLGSLLLGVAVSTFFTGAEFSVNKTNILDISSPKMPIISAWETPFHGLEALWTTENLAFVQNISLGLAVFFLARVLANLYFQNNIKDENIYKKSQKSLIYNSVLFLIFFLFWLIRLLFLDGFAVNPSNREVFMEPNKYFHNFLEMPLVLAVFLIGVVMVLAGIAGNMFFKSKKGIWFSGLGTVLTVWMLFLIAGFNNTAFYPSTQDLQSSLTIYNASSSEFTLKTMSYVSLLVPFVVAYIALVWKKMDSKEISSEELKDSENHIY
ncbi:cytochrome d ubiquinol oxidase subunit II [Elizabethkingia miricola]|uniref:cytochrome d ubiquinol oxidase subunit II n=1 Tax=Elizabethkingia miricola TaxID=172045 RepID=UPI00293CC64B|nr:cytochrome d ubiquinol oxidase subunit II [Elizabethkingia miricola]MDV3462907.1 cytochrome d ubiquinol oxidase subunit II [Elizabethkingia anophelis]WQM38080.1 cytochrome d ubiquinol oxidase subunit II [Elizabethkingia miricola]